MRQNLELQQFEMLGYGAEGGTMNQSYFDLDDAAGFQGSVFNRKLLNLRKVCWMSPRAHIEQIPADWSSIDVAIYHCYLEKANLLGAYFNVFVSSHARQDKWQKIWTQ